MLKVLDADLICKVTHPLPMNLYSAPPVAVKTTNSPGQISKVSEATFVPDVAVPRSPGGGEAATATWIGPPSSVHETKFNVLTISRR